MATPARRARARASLAALVVAGVALGAAALQARSADPTPQAAPVPAPSGTPGVLEPTAPTAVPTVVPPVAPEQPAPGAPVSEEQRVAEESYAAALAAQAAQDAQDAAAQGGGPVVGPQQAPLDDRAAIEAAEQERRRDRTEGEALEPARPGQGEVGPVVRFAGCPELRATYPGGVAESGAVDRRPAGAGPAVVPTTDTPLYDANREHDLDGDGVACET